MVNLDIVYPLQSANGSNVHKLEFLNHLAEQNIRIYAICDQETIFRNPAAIHSVRIPRSNLPLTYVRYCLAISRLALVEGFDFIYTRSSLFSVMGYCLLRLRGRRPLFVEVNGEIDDENDMIKETGGTGKGKNPVRRYIQQLNWRSGKFAQNFFYKRADAFIAVTEGLKKHLIEEYKIPAEIITVVENGANTRIFMPMDQGLTQSKLGLSPSNLYVCFVGNFAPWQGVEFLIEAISRVRAARPDARFLIVGDGVMRGPWIELAERRGVMDVCVFPGSVPYEQVPMYMNASDVCVAPFIIARNAKIGLSPLKLYEYLACGKPVVASAIMGVTDLLVKSSGGIPVPPEDPRALADAIVTLLQDGQLRRKMGASGNEYVMKNHSWAGVASRIAGVVRTVHRRSS